MDYPFKNLIITHQEVEELSNLNLLTHLKLDFYQAFFLKNVKARQRILGTESSLLLISFILLTPIVLIFFRSIAIISNDSQGLAVLVLGLLIVLLMVLTGLNIYLKQTCLSLQTASKILLEIDQYNRVVQSLELLQALQSSATDEQSPEAISFNVLTTIRQSLLRAVTVEQLLRTELEHHLDFPRIAQQLEQDLEQLIFHENHASGLWENHQLLADTLKISMMVHQEVQNLSRHSL